MAAPLGVYICSGCGIGDAIDTDKLAKCSKPAAKVHSFLCGAEGLEMIRADGAAKVVIGACSPRMKAEAFTFEHERVNLREHVAWCHTPKDEDTFMLAQDYLAMGIAKAQKVTVPQPLPGGISKKLLVVGDGVAGAAAAEGAARGGLRGGGARQGAPHREDRGTAGPVRRDGRERRGAGDDARGRHRAGHGVETLRRHEAGPPGLRREPGRHHQRAVRRDEGGGAIRAAVRRQGAAQRAVRAVRRLARREPPALLLHGLLPDHAAARGLHPGSRAPTRRSTSSTRTCARRGRPRCSTARRRTTPSPS